MRPLITSCALCAATLVAGPALAEPIAPKVLVVTMFAEETAPWLEGRPADTRVTVAGLSKDFPDVACDAVGLCVMTTSMGYANAATSVSAVIFSGAFDLTRTYFLVAGIAGVDPSDGTLGSALWARYVIDGGLRHEIDPRQIPSGWPNGMFGLGADAPGQKPTWGAGTEVYPPPPATAVRTPRVLGLDGGGAAGPSKRKRSQRLCGAVIAVLREGSSPRAETRYVPYTGLRPEDSRGEHCGRSVAALRRSSPGSGYFS